MLAMGEWSMALSRKVLVVDDNVDAANLTAEILRIFGMDVAVAYGGPEALAAAELEQPDVVFLDLGMPGMDGYAVAKALRSKPASSGLKIIALTAWGDPASREKTKAAGFDLHLTKPAGIAELVQFAS